MLVVCTPFWLLARQTFVALKFVLVTFANQKCGRTNNCLDIFSGEKFYYCLISYIENMNAGLLYLYRAGLFFIRTKKLLWSIDYFDVHTQKSWNWNLNKTFSGILYVLTHNKQASSFYALQAIDVAAEHFQKTLERLVWEKKIGFASSI